MDMREVFIVDGRRFSGMAGFYDEVERVFIFGLDRKTGQNLNVFTETDMKDLSLRPEWNQLF